MITFIKNYAHPGILFPLANLFAFLQSHDTVAIRISIVTLFLAIFFRITELNKSHSLNHVSDQLHRHLPRILIVQFMPLRIVAYGVLASGIFSLASGALLPGLAGIVFLSATCWHQVRKLPPCSTTLTRPAG